MNKQINSVKSDFDSKQPKSYNFEDWKGGARSLNQEFDYLIDDIEGEIPPELNGTLFRNGPGLLDVNGQGLHHPWDGDGIICAIAFSQGQAHFRNRFIETEGYLAERTAKHILYRGVFGTQKPGGWLAVVTCNANRSDLQSRHLQTRIKCNYNCASARINCN
jgi:all-trans-8'-apo-beta-carotenal 15,15'-oxygenase